MATQSLINTISVNTAKIPMLLALEPMLTILCLWCALHLGIIYLFFEFFREHLVCSGKQHHS